MREEYEEKGFSPLKVGIIGAVIVAALVGVLVQFRSYSEDKESMQKEQAALSQELGKVKKENDGLKQKIEDLAENSHSAVARLEKQIKLKDSMIAGARNDVETGNRNAETAIAQLKKEKAQLESDVALAKKMAEQQALEVKKGQDQFAKLQLDLKSARSDADRYAKESKILQDKLKNIDAGDQSAADLMVQQLSEARQQLKREKAARQRLEEELDSLKGQPPPNPQ